MQKCSNPKCKLNRLIPTAAAPFPRAREYAACTPEFRVTLITISLLRLSTAGLEDRSGTARQRPGRHLVQNCSARSPKTVEIQSHLQKKLQLPARRRLQLATAAADGEKRILSSKSRSRSPKKPGKRTRRAFRRATLRSTWLPEHKEEAPRRGQKPLRGQ